MTQREGQLECALTNGYVVIFQEGTQDEYFIPNSDIAIDSQMFNDENSQPFNNYSIVTATNGDLATGIENLIQIYILHKHVCFDECVLAEH